ncbi:hypothetical protein DRN32_01745 [Thermococci archaeon]|nr:MAG: hypothetical protein DRN32_01745 [Thermococci archaeon]
MLEEVEDGVCIVLDEVLTEVEKVSERKVIVRDVVKIEGLELPWEEKVTVVVGKDGRLYLPV